MSSGTRTLAAGTLLGAAVVAVAACGRHESGRDLLSTPPHEVLEQPGLLTPDPEAQWGSHGQVGWLRYTGVDGRSQPFVWSDRPAVGLRLPATAPVDRVLEVAGFLPAAADSPDEEQVVVRLNGVEVGRGPLSIHPGGVIRVEIPAAVWVAGDNQLELDLGHLRTTAGGEQLGLALNSVSYGPEQRIGAGPGGEGLVLPGGTRIRYLIEEPDQEGAPRLHVRGRSSGPGQLALSYSALDPERGTLELLTDPPLRIESGGGDVDAALPILGAGGRTLRVELAWSPAQGVESELHLESLTLPRLEPSRTPPIVLISIDTLAARHMSLYGYHRETTPNLERFAQEAVTFERCVANAPWTLPSYMSLMTGQHPYSHYRSFDWDSGRLPQLWDLWELAENRWTLAEMLRANGYRTGGFVDNLWLTERFRFPQGFHAFDSSAGHVPAENPRGGIHHVLPLAEAWLDTLPPGDPFFLFVHAFDVHAPFLPADPWRGAFHGDEHFDGERSAPAGGMAKSFRSIPEHVAEPFRDGATTPDEMPTAPITAAYDEEVLAIDEALGDFFERLRARGLFDECVIVLTADHGESHTGHEYYFEHGVVWEDVARVPLIVRLPGGEHGGRRVGGSVQLVDLYPTLLDLLGRDPGRAGLHGRSLLPALRGEDLAPAPTFCEGGIMRQVAVELDGWALIEAWPKLDSRIQTTLTHPLLPDGWRDEHVPEYAGGALGSDTLDAIFERVGHADLQPRVWEQLPDVYHELYYLPDDPWQERDLATERPEQVERMAALLDPFRAQVQAARDQAATTGERVEFSPEQLEELRDLGYLDDD